jgi:hypothetical protein
MGARLKNLSTSGGMLITIASEQLVMSILGSAAKTGAKAADDALGVISKQLGEIASKLTPAAKSAGETVIRIGDDAYRAAPGIIAKYPLPAAVGAGLVGAGGITGVYMLTEAASPYIPGDFNFAFGDKSPGGNVWKPYNTQTGKYEDEKKDYGWVKYVAIGGVAVIGILGVGYVMKQANTTVSIIKPRK